MRLRFALLGAWFAFALGAFAQLHFPGAEWEAHPDPASVGFDAERLERIRTRVAAMPTTAMMIVVGGRVVFEHGDLTAQSYLASVRKSLLAMLYGKYVEDGTIDLQRTLAELDLDDVQGLTDDEKLATVEHLLQARSGIFHPASNAGDDTNSAPERGSVRPGAYYLYNNWDFNAAGTAFEMMTGKNIYDAFESDIAKPIGLQDWDRARQRKSGNARDSRHLAYHFHLTTRDMARVGHLMLAQGRWHEKQVLSENWIARMLHLHTPRAEMNPRSRRQGRHGYGYMWWIWDGPTNTGPYQGAYTANGAYGQYITVLPALDMVVAHKTVPPDNTSGAAYFGLLDLIVDGLSSLPRVK